MVKENNIQAEIEQCKIAECSTKQEGADLIVSTTILPTTYDIPTIKATGYITGINTTHWIKNIECIEVVLYL